MTVERPSFEHETVFALSDMLESEFATTVKPAQLGDLRGMLLTGARGKNSLVASQELSDTQLIYLYTHVASHLILFQIGPNWSFLESRYSDGVPVLNNYPEELNQHRSADALTEGILSDEIETKWEKVRNNIGIGPNQEVLEEYIKRKSAVVRLALGSGKFPLIGRDSW